MHACHINVIIFVLELYSLIHCLMALIKHSYSSYLYMLFHQASIHVHQDMSMKMSLLCLYRTHHGIIEHHHCIRQYLKNEFMQKHIAIYYIVTAPMTSFVVSIHFIWIAMNFLQIFCSRNAPITTQFIIYIVSHIYMYKDQIDVSAILLRHARTVYCFYP